MDDVFVVGAPKTMYNDLGETDHCPGFKEGTGIPAALNYVNCLRNAISRNDLITMRRHEKAEFYKSSFKECRERLEKEDSEKNAESEQKSKSMLPLGQLSLMDLFEL